MAHPDDEVIFGWPLLKEVSSILICSNDKTHSERAGCQRGKALEDVGRLLGIPVKSLDYNSRFYQLLQIDGTLAQFQNLVQLGIDFKTDAVFTHNPVGEYGHMDHILVHLTLCRLRMPMIFSDIYLPMGWLNFEGFPRKLMPDRESISHIGLEVDMDLFRKCKAIYDSYGAWTWGPVPPIQCNLYTVT